MKSFNKLSGIVASLPQVNIDTDAIIPKQFLKTIERTGLGKHLFHEKRYDKENNLNDSFVLNKEPWNKSNIIERNFRRNARQIKKEFSCNSFF